MDNREVDDMEEYEKSIWDRVYLGTLILFGILFGSCILGILFCCYVKVKTGQWPNWV